MIMESYLHTEYTSYDFRVSGVEIVDSGLTFNVCEEKMPEIS